MKDRIKQLQESQRLNQQQFADLLNLPTATLSNIYNNRTNPTLNHVEAIRANIPNVNIEWLLFGNGPMFIDAGSATSTVQNPQNQLSMSPSPSNNQGSTEGSYPQSEGLLNFGDFSPTSSTPQRDNQQHARQAYGQSMAINAQNLTAKNLDKPRRQISEIRIFFDDQTWETFVPKK